MTKRKKLGFAFFAPLLFAIGTHVYFRATERPISINGNISREELITIKSIVRHEMWRGTFPDWSWKTVKNLPGAVTTNLSLRIDSISIASLQFSPDSPVNTADTAWVRVLSESSSHVAVYDYHFVKRSNQWTFLARTGPYNPDRPISLW